MAVKRRGCVEATVGYKKVQCTSQQLDTRFFGDRLQKHLNKNAIKSSQHKANLIKNLRNKNVIKSGQSCYQDNAIKQQLVG